MVRSDWPPVSSGRSRLPVSASDREYREPRTQIERPFRSRKPFGLLVHEELAQRSPSGWPWRVYRDASGAETPAVRRSHHHDRLSRGRACFDARLGALRGNKGGREDFHTRFSQRGGKPRHYGQ
jgi:hypothetical protein